LVLWPARGASVGTEWKNGGVKEWTLQTGSSALPLFHSSAPPPALYFALGSPGGPTIINTVLQVVVNVLDHGMSLQQPVNAPRLHHQWLPDRVSHEPFGLPRDVADALKAKGHALADRPGYLGDVEAVMIERETGVRLGAADPRSPDARAVGY